MSKVILDTNYILALLDKNDIHHYIAMEIDERIEAVFDDILYFDCVINEVISITLKRLKERKKNELILDYLHRLHQIVPKTNITWIYPEIEDYYDSTIQLVKKSEGVLNFHDALIVVVANKFGIGHIVSFDKGFDKTKLKRIKDARDI